MPKNLTKSLKGVAPSDDPQQGGSGGGRRRPEHQNPRNPNPPPEEVDTDNEEENDEPAGASADQEALRRVPPLLREVTLDEQEKQSTIRVSQPFITEAIMGRAVPDTLIYLAYQNLKRNGISPVEMQSQTIWVSELNSLFDEQGRFEMMRQAGVGSPFLDQLLHMLKLANLHLRDYNLMVGTVFFDETSELSKKDGVFSTISRI